jgi:hypothetical protein
VGDIFLGPKLMAYLGSIIEHLGSSINPLERAISGSAYVVGILLLWTSIKKARTMADKRARAGSGGYVSVIMAYAAGGMVFLYLPSFVDIARNTFFGMDSPIAYANWFNELKSKYGDSVYMMLRLVNLAGLIWFVRGIMLMVQATSPGVQHGAKGLGFMLAGIFAMNAEYTVNGVAYFMNTIAELTK